MLDPEHEGKDAFCLFSKERLYPSLSPHGGPEGGKLEGPEVLTPPAGKKPYETCVILRIWLSEIDPIAPGHTTYAYKPSVKSKFSMLSK